VTRHTLLKEMGVTQWYPRYRLKGAVSLHEDVATSLRSPSHSNFNAPPSSFNSATEVSPLVEKVKFEGVKSKVELSAVNLSSTELGEAEVNTKDLVFQAAEPLLLEEAQNLQDKGLNQHEGTLKDATSFTLSTRAISFRCFQLRGCVVVTETESGSLFEPEFDLFRNILACCNFINSHAQNDVVNQGVVATQAKTFSSFSWPVFSAKSMVELQSDQHEAIFKRWLDEQTKLTFSAFFYFGRGSTGHKAMCENTLSQMPDTLIPFYAFEHSLADLLTLPAKKSDVWSLISSQNALVSH